MRRVQAFTVDEMVDVLEESNTTYIANVSTDGDGSVIIILRNSDTERVAEVVVENHLGSLDVQIWDYDHLDNDPSYMRTLYGEKEDV